MMAEGRAGHAEGGKKNNMGASGRMLQNGNIGRETMNFHCITR
jgi:hypothetical protein